MFQRQGQLLAFPSQIQLDLKRQFGVHLVSPCRIYAHIFVLVSPYTVTKTIQVPVFSESYSEMTNDRVFLYTPLKHRLYRGKLLHACGRYRPESVQEAGTTLFISQSNPIASQVRSSFTELYGTLVKYSTYSI